MAAAGLCETCTHRKEIRNDRGSVFIMCLLGLTDPAYPKYPRLPVLQCAGYEPRSGTLDSVDTSDHEISRPAKPETRRR